MWCLTKKTRQQEKDDDVENKKSINVSDLYKSVERDCNRCLFRVLESHDAPSDSFELKQGNVSLFWFETLWTNRIKAWKVAALCTADAFAPLFAKATTKWCVKQRHLTDTHGYFITIYRSGNPILEIRKHFLVWRQGTDEWVVETKLWVHLYVHSVVPKFDCSVTWHQVPQLLLQK